MCSPYLFGGLKTHVSDKALQCYKRFAMPMRTTQKDNKFGAIPGTHSLHCPQMPARLSSAQCCFDENCSDNVEQSHENLGRQLNRSEVAGFAISKTIFRIASNPNPSTWQASLMPEDGSIAASTVWRSLWGLSGRSRPVFLRLCEVYPD